MSHPVDLIGMNARSVGVANGRSIDWVVARSVTVSVIHAKGGREILA